MYDILFVYGDFCFNTQHNTRIRCRFFLSTSVMLNSSYILVNATKTTNVVAIRNHQELQAPISNEVLFKPSAHSYKLSANMIQNLTKYSKKDQEDLISIQSRLRKWIGSDKFVTLDKFIDLMDTIAPHVSVPQSTNMFNQMDPSNNGQIETALLLHDEFLPHMILVYIPILY